jgi:hypothetical protein
MWSWIKKWFVKETVDSYEVYSLSDRSIYKYFDGEKLVSVDPMVLYKKLQAVRPELNLDIKLANSVLLKWEEKSKAHNAMIKKIRDIFVLKSFEENGLTETESVELLDHFLVYCEGVKKNSSPSQTSQTETLPSSECSTEDPSDTSNSSESGSTESESSTAEQEPSPSEVPSPKES